MKPLRTMAILTIMGFWIGAAHGDIYYWMDSQGVRHFTSSEPPAQAEAAKIYLKTPENSTENQSEDTSNPLTFQNYNELPIIESMDRSLPSPADVENSEDEDESEYFESDVLMDS